MALLVRSGLVSGTTGTTTTVTGVGFRPAGLVLWLNATGTGIGSCAHVWADGDGGWSRHGWSKDASATTSTGGGVQQGVMVPTSTGTASHTGTVVADSNGFSITWGATGGAVPFQMAWQAIGGGYVWASTVAVTTLAGINATTKRLSVRPATAKAWTPIAAILLPSQAGGSNYGIGAISSSGGVQQWAATSFCKDGSASGNTQQAWYAKTVGTTEANAACVAWIDQSATLVTRATGAMVAGGIDLTFTAKPANPGDFGFVGLVIGGADPVSGGSVYEAEALSVLKTTATAPATMTLPSTSDRDARWIVMASTRATAAGPTTGMTLGIGGATTNGGISMQGTEGRWSATLVDRDGVATSSASAALDATKTMRLPTTSGTVTYPVEIAVNLEGTTVGLTIIPNDTRAERIGYLRLSQTREAGSLTLAAPATAVVTARGDLTAKVTPNMTNVTQPATLAVTATGGLRTAVGFIATATAEITASAWAFGPVVAAAGSATVAVTASATRMGDAHPVAGSATLAVTVSAALGTKAGMASTATAAVQTGAALRYVMPTITPAGITEIAGTVNLVADPGWEAGTRWTTTGGATLANAGTVWHGTRSATATLNGGTVAVGTPVGLAVDPGTYVGSFFALNPTTALQARLVVTLTDGTTLTGAWAAAVAGTGWRRVTTPTVVVPTGKAVDAARIEIAGGTTATVDGFQIERGETPTAWCSGALGSPAGAWLGGANASPSYRLTQPMKAHTGGRGGNVRVSARLYRATYRNTLVEDISAHVIDGEVTWTRDAEITWGLSCAITGEGWARLTPYQDWVAPVLRVEQADGTVSEAQLGLYLVMDSPETHREAGSVIDLRAYDPCYLLRMQGFSGSVVAQGSKIGAVRKVLDGAVLTGGDKGVKRYDIPPLPSGREQEFKRRREWSADENRLAVVNDILFGAGCSTLWATNDGTLTTRRRSVEKLRDSQPIHVWAANESGDGTSDVLDAVTTDPMTDDRENEIVIVSDNAGNGRNVYVKGRYAKGQNGRPDAVDPERRKARRVRHPMVQDRATALEVAEVLLEELGLRNEGVTITVLPDPVLLASLPWKVVGLAIWNAAGEPVATGLHLVDGFRIGFTPESATAEVTLLRVSMLTTEITQAEGA